MPHAARRLTAADRPAAVSTLAAAFADDPAMTFIWPDPAERARRLPAFMELIWDGDMADPSAGGSGWGTANAEAVTLWLPPGHASPSFLDLLKQAPRLWRVFGTAVPRALVLSHALGANHPLEPHAYLHFAGCHPAHQGRGLGGSAIRAGLAAAGALPAFLETPKESNVGLYQALGFRVVNDYQIPRGPRFWAMARPAA
jgi:hypothetical protein